MHLQQVTFRADKQVRKTNHVMKGVAMGDVGPNEECKWEDEVKNIPPVPPTKLGGSCKNIEVKYFLTVRNVIPYIILSHTREFGFNILLKQFEMHLKYRRSCFWSVSML